uniref:Uncharacterized protein n=1 Tax=Human herpesvirus 2 TaxID=10310 RepID=A0A481TWT3_HHV2|nr:hypothetical protein [Human alphaherpesvirus 2]QBH85225.1 hypothetical protein [Human alphaherpesvirus 2]
MLITFLAEHAEPRAPPGGWADRPLLVPWAS